MALKPSAIAAAFNLQQEGVQGGDKQDTDPRQSRCVSEK